MTKVKLNSVQAKALANKIAREAQEQANAKIIRNFPKKYATEIATMSKLWTVREQLRRELEKAEAALDKMGRTLSENNDVVYDEWSAKSLKPRTGCVTDQDVETLYERIIIMTINTDGFDLDVFTEYLIKQMVDEKTK